MRIEFKILCIILKLIRHGESAPQYLAELISVHESNIRTESCDGVKLNHPEVRPMPRKEYGDRAFYIYAPNLWNRLPAYLKTVNEHGLFKSQLKTFLFKRYYS